MSREKEIEAEKDAERQEKARLKAAEAKAKAEEKKGNKVKRVYLMKAPDHRTSGRTAQVHEDNLKTWEDNGYTKAGTIKVIGGIEDKHAAEDQKRKRELLEKIKAEQKRMGVRR